MKLQPCSEEVLFFDESLGCSFVLPCEEGIVLLS